MLRFLTLVILVLAVAAGIFYFASERVLTPVVRQSLDRAGAHAADLGIRIEEASVESARWQFPAAVAVNGLNLGIQFIEPQEDIPASLKISVKQITAALTNFDDRQIGIKIEGFVINFPETGSDKTGHQKIEAYAQLNTRLDFTEPGKAAKQAQALARDLLFLIKSGRSKTPVDFYGTAAFLFNGQSIEGRLRTDRRVEESVLLMDKEDLKNFASKHLAEPLTHSEIELMSENPSRAPRLLKIRDDTQRKAQAAKDQNPDVPEDAYRHVLWSYRLTKVYGEVFSKQVTDAHERKIAGTNPDEERKTDLSHNALGRRYAMVGFQESSLLDTLMRDSDAVKYQAEFKEETVVEEDEALPEEEEEEDRRPVNILGEIGT